MIVSTENALLARLLALFGNTFCYIAAHPGDWSEERLRDVLLNDALGVSGVAGRRPVRPRE